LYVGKSKNIHSRVLAHLGNKNSRRTIEMSERIAGISFELTGSELIALLLESEEIKKNKPRYNRAQRRTASGWGLYSHYDQRGYINFEIRKTGEKNSVAITSFNNKTEARQILGSLVEKHWLCQKLCGLYTTEGACFHYDIRQCNGACIGKEPVKTYNDRAMKLTKSFELEMENVLIIDQGRTAEEKSAILIENGIYRGFGYFDISDTYVNIDELKNCIKKHEDNRDVRYIIKSWLRRNKVEKLVNF
jgi:DNA polymerase-3 subunit epsilon